MRVCRTKIEEHSPEEIEAERLFNVFVIGLPRSGTSMMSNVVKQLGVNFIETSEDPEFKKERDSFYKKKLGQYHPNVKGFFEIGFNVWESLIKLHSQPYSGCKLIAPVQHLREQILRFSACKVVFMWREPAEIKESQERFYSNRSDLAYIRAVLQEQPVWLKEDGIPFIKIGYRDVLRNPEAEISKVARFINSPRVIDDAVASVDQRLNRVRAEDLAA